MIVRSAFRRLWLALALFCGASAAAAHPHVWVTVECAFAVDERREVTSVRQSWTFDEMYSAFALYGVDADRDGVYSSAELARLTAVMAGSAREDCYFTQASIDGVAAPLSETGPAELRVSPSGAVVMSFTQTFPPKTSIAGKALRFEVRDPDLYVDFEFSKERFGDVMPSQPGCSAELRDNQPPKDANPDELMNALISGPLKTLASAVTLRCR